MADAERLLKEALALDPRSPMANRTLAALYLVTNRLAEAEGPLRVIADLDKDAFPPRLALADYYLAVGRDEEGVKLLEARGEDEGRRDASPRSGWRSTSTRRGSTPRPTRASTARSRPTQGPPAAAC